ncbi:hypothetical protein DERF_012266 [Dermatophagoides farinae]|uniref:Uncharacterized protein n=1 Tax=Dermatophagoides farinae TaxID=6954 RepID=A0A922HRI9_DERFA|nr:hypothetical protein DERF_012266 [Dermatophagoides farinae]
MEIFIEISVQCKFTIPMMIDHQLAITVIEAVTFCQHDAGIRSVECIQLVWRQSSTCLRTGRFCSRCRC